LKIPTKIVGLELAQTITSPNLLIPARWWRGFKTVLRQGSAWGGVASNSRNSRPAVDLNRHEASLQRQSLDLTPTEFNLLKALVEQPDRAFTRLELIETGWVMLTRVWNAP